MRLRHVVYWRGCVVRHDVVAVDNDNGDNGHNAVTSDFRRALLRQTWGQKRDVTNGQIYHGGTKAGPHSRQPGPRTGRILCHLCENVKIYPLLSIAFWWMDARWGVVLFVWCLPTSGVQWCRTSNKNLSIDRVTNCCFKGPNLAAIWL